MFITDMHGHSENHVSNCHVVQMANLSHGCKVNILEWNLQEKVYVEQPQGYEGSRRRRQSIQIEQNTVWFETSSESLVDSHRLLSHT